MYVGDWCSSDIVRDSLHYSDVIMSAMASQIADVSIVCSTSLGWDGMGWDGMGDGGWDGIYFILSRTNYKQITLA